MYLKTGLKLKNAPAATKTWWQCLWFCSGSSKHLVESLKECCRCSTCSSVEGWRGIHSDLFSGHTDLLQTKQEEHSWIQCINWQVTHWKGDCIHFTNIFLHFTKLYLSDDVILCFKGLTKKQMIKSNISKDCSWSSCVKSWWTDQGQSKASYTQILNLWKQTPVIIPICDLGVSMLPHSFFIKFLPLYTHHDCWADLQLSHSWWDQGHQILRWQFSDTITCLICKDSRLQFSRSSHCPIFQ